MTTAIVKQQLTPDVWQMITEIAPVMKQSQLFGVGSTQAAMAIMVKGHELGLSLTASFQFIHVINNRPTLSPKGALALINQSGLCEELTIEEKADSKGNPKSCTVTMKRDSKPYTVSFSMDDAKKAGLIKPNSGWEKYPANMLKWRAIGYCADVVFPDILGGMHRTEELGGEITPEGEVITADWKVTESQPQKQEKSALDKLVEEFGAEAVMTANNGAIPSTDDEIKDVRFLLESKVNEPIEEDSSE